MRGIKAEVVPRFARPPSGAPTGKSRATCCTTQPCVFDQDPQCHRTSPCVPRPSEHAASPQADARARVRAQAGDRETALTTNSRLVPQRSHAAIGHRDGQEIRRQSEAPTRAAHAAAKCAGDAARWGGSAVARLPRRSGGQPGADWPARRLESPTSRAWKSAARVLPPAARPRLRPRASSAASDSKSGRRSARPAPAHDCARGW